jgi:hypothetical protein
MVGRRMFKLKEKTSELIVLGILYLSLLAYSYLVLFGDSIAFIDTDDFMRVMRIKEFFNDYNLSNYIVSRSNYPDGCELHWTRLYDFFIIGLTWVIDLFSESLDQSINYACFIISPIVGLICMVFVSKIFDQFIPKSNVFLATALFCASPFLFPFFSFGRPDHHSFITLCITIYMYCTVKIVLDKTDSIKNYIITAVAAAACVWASPETLIVLLLTDAVLFCVYMEDFQKTKILYLKNLLTACFVGIIAMIPNVGSNFFHCLLMSILLLLVPYTTLSRRSLNNDTFFKYWHYVCLLFMMLFLTEISPVEYDKISIVHTTLFLCISAFFAVNLQLIGRKSHLYDAITWAIVIGLIFLSMFPRFLMGMSADIPPFIKKIWLNKIAELRSPFAGSLLWSFLFYSVVTVTSIFVKIQELRKQEITKTNIIWAIFVIIASCYWILACFAYRMVPYSVLFGLPIVVSFGMSSKYVRNYSKLLRMIFTMIISCLFFLVTSYFCESDVDVKDTAQKYSDAELYECIDNLSYKPVVIMAHSNYGPKLIYYTKHFVLGAPYHRQIEGIALSYAVMEMNKDIETVRKVLEHTNTHFIFVNHKQQTEFPNSFASSLLAGHLPKWISIVKIPEKFYAHSVFKVDQDLLKKEIQLEEDSQK